MHPLYIFSGSRIIFRQPAANAKEIFATVFARLFI